MINRIVGHWKGFGVSPLKLSPSAGDEDRGFPWNLPVVGSIPWNSQRYMESIESSSNAEPVSSANRSSGGKAGIMSGN